MPVPLELLVALLALGALLLGLQLGGRRVVPGRALVIERLGRYHRTLGPGRHVIVPGLDRVRSAPSLEEATVSFPSRLALTRDAQQLRLDSVARFVIQDPVAATYSVEDVPAALEREMFRALDETAASLTRTEMLTSAERLNELLTLRLESGARLWGVSVLEVELRSAPPAPGVRELN